MISLNPATVSRSESPIPIEFEDEKTATLMNLLNKIEKEITEVEQTPFNMLKFKDFAKDVRQLELKSLNQSKQQTDVSSNSNSKQKQSNLIKKDDMQQNLSAHKLLNADKNTNKKSGTAVNTTKKMAPKAPVICKDVQAFSVETGIAGLKRTSGYKFANAPVVDLTFVDVEDRDDFEMADDVSEINSVASSCSPIRNKLNRK